MVERRFSRRKFLGLMGAGAVASYPASRVGVNWYINSKFRDSESMHEDLKKSLREIVNKAFDEYLPVAKFPQSWIEAGSEKKGPNDGLLGEVLDRVYGGVELAKDGVKALPNLGKEIYASGVTYLETGQTVRQIRERVLPDAYKAVDTLVDSGKFYFTSPSLWNALTAEKKEMQLWYRGGEHLNKNYGESHVANLLIEKIDGKWKLIENSDREIGGNTFRRYLEEVVFYDIGMRAK